MYVHYACRGFISLSVSLLARLSSEQLASPWDFLENKKFTSEWCGLGLRSPASQQRFQLVSSGYLRSCRVSQLWNSVSDVSWELINSFEEAFVSALKGVACYAPVLCAVFSPAKAELETAFSLSACEKTTITALFLEKTEVLSTVNKPGDRNIGRATLESAWPGVLSLRGTMGS